MSDANHETWRILDINTSVRLELSFTSGEVNRAVGPTWELELLGRGKDARADVAQEEEAANARVGVLGEFPGYSGCEEVADLTELAEGSTSHLSYYGTLSMDPRMVSRNLFARFPIECWLDSLPSGLLGSTSSDWFP